MLKNTTTRYKSFSHQTQTNKQANTNLPTNHPIMPSAGYSLHPHVRDDGEKYNWEAARYWRFIPQWVQEKGVDLGGKAMFHCPTCSHSWTSSEAVVTFYHWPKKQVTIPSYPF